MTAPAIPVDALLLALADWSLAYGAAIDGFDTVTLNYGEDDLGKEYVTGAQRHASARRDILREAICSLPADGPAGAAVQLATLESVISQGAPDGASKQEGRRYQAAVACAFASIGAILSRAVKDAGQREIAGLGPLAIRVSPHVIGAWEFDSEMHRQFEEFRTRNGAAREVG